MNILRVTLVTSSTIDYIDGNKRCGGSTVYSPIPLLVLSADFVVYYLTCTGYEIDFPFESTLILADKCFIFKHKYITLDHRESSILSMPSEPVKLKINARDLDTIVISPLLREFALDSIREILEQSNLSIIDLQGFIRSVNKNGRVVFSMPNEGLRRTLGEADVLIASSDEYKWEPFGNIFILTMGENGARAFWNNKSVHIPTIKVNKVPVGTGDMFASSFAYCYSKEGNVESCLVFANAMVSTLLEHVEFNSNGCVNYKKIIDNRDEILAEFEKRRRKIIDSI